MPKNADPIKSIELVLTPDEARHMAQHLKALKPWLFTNMHFVINGVNVRKDIEIKFG